MTLVYPYTSVLMAVIVSNSKLCCSNVAQFVIDSWVLGLTGSTTVLLLTLAKAACANKMADFIAPFMKNLASKIKMQLMYSTW